MEGPTAKRIVWRIGSSSWFQKVSEGDGAERRMRHLRRRIRLICAGCPEGPSCAVGSWGRPASESAPYVTLTGPKEGRPPPEVVHVAYPLGGAALEKVARVRMAREGDPRSTIPRWRGSAF